MGPGTSPGRRLLAARPSPTLSLGDLSARLGGEFGDGPVERRGQGMLHLHRLERHQPLALGDVLALPTSTAVTLPGIGASISPSWTPCDVPVPRGIELDFEILTLAEHHDAVAHQRNPRPSAKIGIVGQTPRLRRRAPTARRAGGIEAKSRAERAANPAVSLGSEDRDRPQPPPTHRFARFQNWAPVRSRYRSIRLVSGSPSLN